MKPRTRIILLSILSILIVITIVLGVTYSFMQANVDSSQITEVSLSSCAKITLEDTGVSINLSNTSPISKNRALQTTPYTFTVTSSCESYIGFNLYLATINTNTLTDANIHYIITKKDSKNILAEGILSEATNALSEFASDDQNQLNIGINGTFGTIYKLYNDSIPLQGEVSYDLYLYIDSEVTDASTMGQTFNAGIAIKSYDREGNPLSNYIINNVYTSDGTNGLYYHDGIGTYTNADQEAGDNSYRYSGANPSNFVCFGSDEETCPYDNLYRIIGVFDDQVKLIKYDYANSTTLSEDGAYGGEYDSLGSNYKGSQESLHGYYWNNSNTNIWSESNLNKINLNINYVNSFPQTWQSKIAQHTWQVGGNTWDNIGLQNAKTVYINEITNPNNNIIYQSKIGLMLVSDYMYAVDPNGWTTIGYDNNGLNDYRNIKDLNWVYMGLYEWTITPTSGYEDVVFLIDGEGFVNVNHVDDLYIGIRPTFYLKSGIEFISGTGTQIDPYRIA